MKSFGILIASITQAGYIATSYLTAARLPLSRPLTLRHVDTVPLNERNTYYHTNYMEFFFCLSCKLKYRNLPIDGRHLELGFSAPSCGTGHKIIEEFYLENLSHNRSNFVCRKLAAGYIVSYIQSPNCCIMVHSKFPVF